MVVPVKNEEANLEEFTTRLVETLEGCCGSAFQVVFAVDPSTDGSLRVLGRLKERYAPRVEIVETLSATGRSGMGPSLRAGFRAATGKFVIKMDADLSHDPKQVPHVLNALRAGHLLVVGSRYLPGQPRFRPTSRYFTSKLFSALGRLVARCHLHDVTTGFLGFRRDLVGSIPLLSDGFEVHAEMNLKFAALLPKSLVKEVPIHYAKRTRGRSKMRYARAFFGYLRALFREVA